MFFSRWGKSSRGEREGRVGEKRMGEGEGKRKLRVGLVLFWCWGAVHLGLVEEVDEILKLFFWRGFFFLGLLRLEAGSTFFLFSEGDCWGGCWDRVSWRSLLRCPFFFLSWLLFPLFVLFVLEWFWLLKLALCFYSWELCWFELLLFLLLILLLLCRLMCLLFWWLFSFFY